MPLLCLKALAAREVSVNKVNNFITALDDWLSLSPEQANTMTLVRKISYGMSKDKPFYKSSALRKLFSKIKNRNDLLTLYQTENLPAGYFTVLINTKDDPSARIAGYHELSGTTELTQHNQTASDLFFDSQVPTLLQLNATLELLKSCSLDVQTLRNGGSRFITLLNLVEHQEGIARFCKDLIEDYRDDLVGEDASVAWARLFSMGMTLEHTGNVAMAEMLYESLPGYDSEGDAMEYRQSVMANQVETADDFDLAVRRMSQIENRDMLSEGLAVLVKSVRIHDTAPQHELVSEVLKRHASTLSNQSEDAHLNLRHEVLRVIISSMRPVADQYCNSIDLSDLKLTISEVIEKIQRLADVNLRIIVPHEEHTKRVALINGMIDNEQMTEAMKHITRQCIESLDARACFPQWVISEKGLLPQLIDIQVDLAQRILGQDDSPSEERQALESAFLKRFSSLIFSQCRKLHDESGLDDDQLLRAADFCMHLPVGRDFLALIRERKIPIRQMSSSKMEHVLSHSFSI